LNVKVSKNAEEVMEGIKNAELFIERNKFDQKDKERMIKFSDAV
jgi:hypothetical protein